MPHWCPKADYRTATAWAEYMGGKDAAFVFLVNAEQEQAAKEAGAGAESGAAAAGSGPQPLQPTQLQYVSLDPKEFARLCAALDRWARPWFTPRSRYWAKGVLRVHAVSVRRKASHCLVSCP